MSTHNSPLILDGGFSRELIRLGAPFKQPEWSALALIEGPDYVRQVHQAFAEAGADVLTTNSYALVPFHIGEERFKGQVGELAGLAGKLARDVADDYVTRGRKMLVAGSLPPIFGSYEPKRFDSKTVQLYLKPLVEALAPYVDVWLGETLSLIAEAEAVKTATSGTGKPLWISFTLDDSNGDNSSSPTLRSGESISEATHWALEARVESLMFNCSSPEYMSAAVKAAREVAACDPHSTPKIGVYANAFEAVAREAAANEYISDTRNELTPEIYLEFARQWISDGANMVGGCCGIGVEHINLLAKQIKSFGDD